MPMISSDFVTMMMFRIMTIFFASICTISGKVLQFPRGEGNLHFIIFSIIPPCQVNCNAVIWKLPLEFYKGQRDSSTSTLHHFAQIMHAWRKELSVKVFLELLLG